MGRRSRIDAVGAALRSRRGRASVKDIGQSASHLAQVAKESRTARPKASVAAEPGNIWDGPTTYVEQKKWLQEELQKQFDFEAYGGLSKDETGEVMKKQMHQIVDGATFTLSRPEREKMFQEIVDNLLGLGPLEPIITDPKITDIMINGPDKCFVEKGGLLREIDCKFDDDDHLLQVIRRIISAVGRKVDEQNPMVDARMLDGSRFNAIIRPCALDGCAVSIRRFGTPIRPEQLVAWNAMPQQQMDFLAACVRAKMNIIISGGTGSGKTTLLNCLSGFVPDGERIVTIEDSAELQLQQDHVVRLESRPPNAEGKGEVTLGDLLVHSLRMRADRIILGEIRGGEAVDMLQAMNSGNPGSMATVHSNSPTDAISRFETMVSIGMPNMSTKFVRSIISSALDIIVQLNRLPDGSRRCTGIAEVTGMEGPFVTMQDIYQFNQTDTIDGVIHGYYAPCGRRPQMLSKLRKIGIEPKDEWFDFELYVAGKQRLANREEAERVAKEAREAYERKRATEEAETI
ncbi:MAG: CpaF family protein [Deltaproteobacteria bacterium]|nr:MAG: CpaF family protein [Deltaproteobacteria bacterium]